jgi:hypothetical protein
MFSITVAGTNPQPPLFILGSGQSQPPILGSGSFTIQETQNDGFIPPFLGACLHANRHHPFVATGTIGAGQSLSCIITNRGP